MRASRLLLPLLAWLVIGAGPDDTLARTAGSAFERLDRGRVTRATVPAGTRMLAVYYGASWCGPCRAFVPELIAAYPRLRARGIEMLFVGDDASCAATLDYARTSRMPWLLLPCDRARHAVLRRLGGKALPGIVVLDRTGSPVANSWQADGNSMPRATLRRLLGSAPAEQVTSYRPRLVPHSLRR